MSQEKECIEYALHIYDIYWDYYKKTIDERNQILNNYIVFVGIPISIMGILIESAGNIIEHYLYVVIFILIMILVLGLVIYSSYIVESFVSERYLKQIEKVTGYLTDNHDVSYGKVFSELYSLDDVFLSKKASQYQRIRKCAIIVIINTGILFSITYLCFEKYIKCYEFLAIGILSVVLHYLLFYYHKKVERA